MVAQDDSLYKSEWKHLRCAGPVPTGIRNWLKHWKPENPAQPRRRPSEAIRIPIQAIKDNLIILVLNFQETSRGDLDCRDINPEIKKLYYQSVNNFRVIETQLSAKSKLTTDEKELSKLLSKLMFDIETRDPPRKFQSISIAMIAAPVVPTDHRLRLHPDVIRRLQQCINNGGSCLAVYLHSEEPILESETEILDMTIIRTVLGTVISGTFIDSDISEVSVPVFVMGIRDNFIDIIAIERPSSRRDGYNQTRDTKICKGLIQFEECHRIRMMRLSTPARAASLGCNHERVVTGSWHPIDETEVEKNISVYAPNMKFRVRDYNSAWEFMRYLARYGYYYFR